MNYSFGVAAIALFCVAVSAGAVAQTVNQAQLENCSQEATAERKLACFEALTLSGRQDAKLPMTNSANAEVPSRTPVMVPDIQQKAPSPAPDPVIAEEVAIDKAGPRESARSDPAAAPAVTPSGSGQPANDEPDENDAMTGTVVDVTRGRLDVLYFHFDDGQIWRQVQGRRFRYPKNRAFEVTISTGVMGDRQLRVEGVGPMTRVRRSDTR